MSKMNSTINARYVFDNARQMMINQKVDPTSATLTQGDLRLEQQLTIARTQYQFAILNNDNGTSGTIFNTEIRLTQQDAFVTSGIGFFLAKPSSAIDTTFILHSYPSPAVFTTSGVAAAAETLYNSILSVMVNNVNILPRLSMRRFRAVNQSQQVAAATNQNGVAQDQIDLSSDGWMVTEPNLVMIGSKGTIITLTLPAILAAVETFQRGVLLLEGVLAQNVTIIT